MIRSPALKEEGSVSIFMIGLFGILLILSAGLVNIADASYAKRELIQILEPIVQSATHEISLARYYSENSRKTRVPIDCDQAILKIRSYVSNSQLRNSKIDLESIQCEEDEITIKVASSIDPIINFPQFDSAVGSLSVSGKIRITAQVGASSIYHYS